MIYPLVTIVTPSYNQGEFIRATIESVLSQDHPNIEYIVMDGGSTDETASIVREYEDRLTFVSERDLGQSHAINKGFKMARGEIVSWLNSDDTILPGAVSRAVKAFQRQPSLGAVYGEGYLIDRNGEIKKRFPATESFNLWKLIHVTDYILQQTVYFRREVFEKIGFVNEQLNWGMDWDLLIRIGKRYEIGFIPEYMGCLREYETAKSFSGGHRRFGELARIMREHGRMRYPPGFFLYGLDTYQAILRRYLPVPIARLVTRAAFQVYARIVQGQGLHADGWAGKHVRYMLPAGTKKVLIKGRLPDIPDLVGQRLRIICNGVFSLEQAIPQGEFQLEFDCTDGDQPPSIEIRALKATRGKTTDRRKIAYHLTEIICAERDIERAITENSSRPHSPFARRREWRTQDSCAGARCRLARFAPKTQFLILTSPRCHDELAALEAKNVSRKLIGGEAKWQSRARRWGGRVRRALICRVPGRFTPAVYEFQRIISKTAYKASLVEDLNVDLLFCPFGTAHLRGRAGLRPDLPIAAIVIDLQHKAYPQFFSQDQITERDHDLNWHRISVIGVGSEFVRQSLLDQGFSELSVKTIYIRLN